MGPGKHPGTFPNLRSESQLIDDSDSPGVMQAWADPLQIQDHKSLSLLMTEEALVLILMLFLQEQR